MAKKLTVVGAGASGMATAAYYTLSGWEVILCDFFEQAGDFEAIIKQNGILLRGMSGRNGCAMPAMLTHDFEEAMQNEHIIVCTSTGRHSEIVSVCAPYISEGSYILFSPGNFGSLWMKKELKRLGKENIVTADLSGNIWACRRTGPGEVLVALPLSTKRLAAYPACDTNKAIEVFSHLLQLNPATNILEAALNSPNVISHVIGALLNAVQIEHMGQEFALFQHGLGEVYINCMSVLEQERNAIMTAIGMNVYSPDSSQFSRALMDTKNHRELDLFRKLDGPSSFSHRYVNEDAACGLSLLVSIGKEYGVPTPVNEAVLALASAINNVDYKNTGYNLGKFQLNNLTKEQLGDNL